MSLKNIPLKLIKKNKTARTVGHYIKIHLDWPQDFSKYDEKERKLLYEIQKNGFAIIPNFVNREFCDSARKEVDRLLKEHKEFVVKNEWPDDRIYGGELLSEKIKEFHNNKFLQNLCDHYLTRPCPNAFTLANWIEISDESKKFGSGGGWHKDNPNRQFKSILYLNDVNERNGAYQIIKRSHKLRQFLKDMKAGELDYGQIRIRDDQMTKILKDEPERLVTCTGKAGTLIVKDCCCIHRGSPLQEGQRYALTNYYFTLDQINQDLVQHFHRVVSKENVLAKAKPLVPTITI